MGAFFSFLLSTIIIVYLIGLVGRLVLRWWVQRKMRQMGADGSGYYGGRRQPKTKEGTVKITQVTRETRAVDKNLGEYVDYEEIEEVVEEERQ